MTVSRADLEAALAHDAAIEGCIAFRAALGPDGQLGELLLEGAQPHGSACMTRAREKPSGPHILRGQGQSFVAETDAGLVVIDFIDMSSNKHQREVENKLQNGDFKGAQIEWQTLPEKGQAAATDYKRKLDERVSVEGLIGAVVSGALNGTTTGATGNQG